MIGLLIAVGFGLAGAAEPDPVFDGIVKEVERAVELRLPDSHPPHHILVRAADGWELRARAHLGQLDWSKVVPNDVLKIEVRAGTPEFDNTGLGNDWTENGIDTSGLPDVPTERLVRERLWGDLDGGYKAAVENLGRKLGAKEELQTPDAPDANWQVIAEPVVAVQREPIDEPELAPMEQLVQAVSGSLRDAGFEDVEVEASERVGHRIIVGSDGTRVVTPLRWIWVGMEIRVRAPNNEVSTFRDFVVARTRDELPSRRELIERIQTLASHARTWAAAPRLEAPWYGPVLLEERAAARIVDKVVVDEVRGTPGQADWRPWDQKATPSSRRAARPGTRLLPRGWSVRDDTSGTEEARCCRAIDSEGVRARSVSLLEDGVVVGHLMTRTPNRYFAESTGHARPAGRNERERAHPNFVIVTPPATVSRSRLRALARKEARRQGVDRVLVLRGAHRDLGFWRYADGREEPVRGFRTSDFDARALRSMVVAGPVQTLDVDHGRSRIRVPDLLLANVELTPSPPRPQPALRRTSPLAAADAVEAR